MKMNRILKDLIKAALFLIAVGSILYIFRDKLKENEYISKLIEKAKNVLDKFHCEDDLEDFEDFDDFEEEEEDLSTSADSSKRGYVSIKISDPEESDDVTE